MRAMCMHGMSRALGTGVPEQRARRRPPFFPLLRVSVWLNKRVVVVLLCYWLAKPEQELMLRRGPFMASERLGVVMPVFSSR